MSRKRRDLTKTVSINFLLGCSNLDLANYEMARLSEIANLRKQMHALLDQTIDHMGLAWLAAWFRDMDRNALKHAIEYEEGPLAWAQRMVKEGQRSEEENEEYQRPPLPPGAAHLAAALRYQQRNIAEGKCCRCPEPLAHNSVRFCEKHLTMSRLKYKPKNAKGAPPGSVGWLYGEGFESQHGRQPGTLASLAMSREKQTRAHLAKLGIPPESAAVSMKAAKEALLRCIPDSIDDAMTQAELFKAAVIPTRTTGQSALKELLLAYRIERTGKGISGDRFRYFVGATPESRRKSPKSRVRQNEAIQKIPKGSRMTALLRDVRLRPRN
jgi:hypothetical protein